MQLGFLGHITSLDSVAHCSNSFPRSNSLRTKKRGKKDDDDAATTTGNDYCHLAAHTDGESLFQDLFKLLIDSSSSCGLLMHIAVHLHSGWPAFEKLPSTYDRTILKASTTHSGIAARLTGI